jgi:lipid II:glycine glycyltransferase (peptidoglycan interpeptide bridge formation enzyme)
VTLTVGPLSLEEHRAFVTERRASFLQSPSWGAVKRDWTSERVGWRDEEGLLVGVGLLLYRQLPVVRRSIAFLTEGPVLDWSAHAVEDVIDPLLALLRRRGSVSLRMGPDLVLHRWSAATVKGAVGAGRRLADVLPDSTDPVAERLGKELAATGWTPAAEKSAPYGSTGHAFRLELTGRTADELLAGMNQQWRRGIRKAEKAGVEVCRGGFDDLADFHRVYEETARRDGFAPHPLAYFQRAWSALSADSTDRIRLYLGRHQGEVLAGMIVVTAGGLAGYAYGGSASHRREVSPSNAVHWRILQDLLAEGADVYDMRAISDSLDPDEPKFGVLRFKVGTGGDTVEHLGDWDRAVRPVLHRAVLWLLPLRARTAGGLVAAQARLRRRTSARVGS